MTARITAFGNQKGGVGKTTLALGVAESLAAAGRRVLVIDADPQANATAQLGVAVNESVLTLNDVLTPDPSTGAVEPGCLADAITSPSEEWRSLVSASGELGVVPAELGLAAQEQIQLLGREFRLRTAIAGDWLHQDWDDVLIDCPPSIGQLTVNALIAAQQVIAVTEPRAASVEGLAQMVRTLAQVQTHYHPELALVGVAVNRFRPDRLDRVAWTDKLVPAYGDTLIEPFVPEREIVAQAASAAAPLSVVGRLTPATGDVLGALDAIAERISQ